MCLASGFDAEVPQSLNYMGEKQKKHFGKSAYIRSVSRAIQIFRFDFPDISMQWRVEGDFPELPEIGRSRVVTNTE